jgi:hypothetical protein
MAHWHSLFFLSGRLLGPGYDFLLPASPEAESALFLFLVYFCQFVWTKHVFNQQLAKP